MRVRCTSAGSLAARLEGGIAGPLQELWVVGAVGADRERLLEIGQGELVRMERRRSFGGAAQGEPRLDRDRLALRPSGMA